MRLDKSSYRFFLLLFSVGISASSFAQKQGTKELRNGFLRLVWQASDSGYALRNLQVYNNSKWESLPGKATGAGGYTVLYSEQQPAKSSVPVFNEKGNAIHFPEPEYRYVTGKWEDATTPVALNRAGEKHSFFPGTAEAKGNSVVFKNEDAVSATTATWMFDKNYQHDVVVTISLKAKKNGYFSIETPSLVNGDPHQFQWGIIPGILQGKTINNDFVDAYAYGHGIPGIPFVARERTAAALTSILTDKNGLSIAVTAAPGTGRDPWLQNKSTQETWLLGLSLRNRQGILTPTLYHPVLGEQQSWLNAGDSVSFSFRYTIQKTDWYTVYKHVVNDVYQFNNTLKLKNTKESLASRIQRLFDYVKSDSTSMWKETDYNGITIGAQHYLGGVFESKKDAIKNADYGAMWMLASMTKDSVLEKQRLPYALNFKIAQQNLTDSFFNGAAAGQYYLVDSKRFTEEWGPYTEPIATTYYLLCDIANVLLFEPDQPQLKRELALAADWLLKMMKADGSWEIAYSNKTHEPLFRDEKDYRPTFYGLLVAYQLLKEQKYLNAAIKGADWFIKNAADNGYFLGVCGDSRFAPDFATAQSAQALLDLYAITGQNKYKEAAIKVGRMYTTSVYSHPIASRLEKEVKGKKVQDWEISQVGLGFEHGGIIGSANTHGPILLASHAGMFVRLFGLTKDSLYLNMARAAAWGRDAFVDPATGVASYYWNAMNNGAGPYPHHAWWQIGWITDYLLSEADIRSGGKIVFPHGFIAPKVGPHRTYGFAPGTIFGKQASLAFFINEIQISNPRIDYVGAYDSLSRTKYLILLNNSVENQTTTITLNTPVKNAVLISADGKKELDLPYGVAGWKVQLPPTGLKVIKIDLSNDGRK